jgi:peptidoglycan/LPS O-acetylase OafA/YrhL
MIQRIQTLFLLLAAICSFLLFAFPFASVPAKVENSALFSNDTVYNLSDNYALLAFYALVGVIALAAIFLFNNRPRQIMVGKVAMGIHLLAIILTIVFFSQDAVMQSETTPNDQLGLYAPIIGLVMLILAVRAIQKDEKLVKSMDRLR